MKLNINYSTHTHAHTHAHTHPHTVWYEFDMGYEWRLVIKFGMRLVCMMNTYFGWRNMICIWLERNSMSLWVRPHGGASVGRDVILWPLLVGVHGGASSI